MHMLTTVAAQSINAWQVTVVGLGVVFGVLALLWLVLTLMNVIFHTPSPAKPAGPTPAQQTPAAPQESISPTSEVNPRVLAVVTAAVAQTLGFIPGDLTIRRVASTSWRKRTAVMAAALSHMDVNEAHIHIEKL